MKQEVEIFTQKKQPLDRILCHNNIYIVTIVRFPIRLLLLIDIQIREMDKKYVNASLITFLPTRTSIAMADFPGGQLDP